MRIAPSTDQQDPTYSYTDTWNRSAWAWAFLRRNGDYQREWQAFIKTWRALEAAYGAPPERDMAAWLADPRAYVQDAVETAEGCIGADDRVLIECALGARWGFYKFPPDPFADERGRTADIAWREVDLSQIKAQHGYTLTIDLALPLAEQLAVAKTRAIAAQRGAQRDSGLCAPTVSAHRAHWRLCLHLLDGQTAGAAAEDLAAILFPALDAGAGRQAVARLAAEAAAWVAGDYRRILLLHDA